MNKISYRNGRVRFESKYRNKKTLVDGIEFDSAKEAKRWVELKEMQDAGLIMGLARQQKFELIPNQRGSDGKIIEKACNYFADFCYVKDGELVVEDVKSDITKKQPEYVMKRKLMLWLHHIRLKEV